MISKSTFSSKDTMDTLRPAGGDGEAGNKYSNVSLNLIRSRRLSKASFTALCSNPSFCQEKDDDDALPPISTAASMITANLGYAGVNEDLVDTIHKMSGLLSTQSHTNANLPKVH